MAAWETGVFTLRSPGKALSLVQGNWNQPRTSALVEKSCGFSHRG